MAGNERGGTAVGKVEILGKESIFVGRNIDEFIAEDLRGIIGANAVADATIAVVTDDLVEKHCYRPRLLPILTERLGIRQENLVLHVIPNGEHSKCRETKEQIEDHMLAARCNRRTLVIALGGGVVGDLAGFVAASFMRGVRFVQIPTTLLAMVDSSIGGKTGLNTPSGKNLVGAFHQPLRVYVDTSFLETLPRRHLNNGMAEVIKSFAIRSGEWFSKVEEPWDLSRQEDLDRLDAAVMKCCQIKADVVTQDEKEGGLRELLNFGHTVGHAIEGHFYDTMLHGECVAIGLVKEAQIARALGHLSSADVTRLATCLSSHGLPTNLTEKNQELTVNQLMDVMSVDKKTVGSTKKVVLLRSLGETVENRASAVDDGLLRLVMAKNIEVQPSGQGLKGTIRVPGSKSISNRVLLLAALGQGTCRITGLLHSDDTRVMMGAISTLGLASFEWENGGATVVVHGGGGAGLLPRGSPPSSRTESTERKEVYLQNAGTASRFLTTLCCMAEGPGPVYVYGNHRMHVRPIRDLVNALTGNGCKITYQGKEGCLPILAQSTGLVGGDIHLAATVSSQYVSSVLMSAPYAQTSVTLNIAGGKTVSQTYIDMTVSLMQQFGIDVKKTVTDTSLTYEIPCGVYKNPPVVAVEADASSSTYPLAFGAISGGEVTVQGVGRVSLQGDAGFCRVLSAMGCTVSQTDSTTTVTGILPDSGQVLTGIDVDMEDLTDAFMTAAAVAAVCPNSVTRITGIANQRVKECNRIAAMVQELGKCGVHCSELEDGIEINGRPANELHGAVIDCHDDHRIAMSFAVLGSVVPGIVIDDKDCVGKTYTEFWEDMQRELGLQYNLEHASTAVARSDDTNTDSTPTVVIVGMRGAGKTSLGSSAARALDFDFLDADQVLEARLGRSIKEHIAEHGWDSFRDEEHATLAGLLKDSAAYGSKGRVIACGGGVVERPENRRLLAAHWPVIHLSRPIGHIEGDLDKAAAAESVGAPGDGTTERPAYAGGVSLTDVWDRRLPWFQDCSSFEFHCSPAAGHVSPDGAYDWKRVERDFSAFLARVLDIHRCQTLPVPSPFPLSGASDIYDHRAWGSFFVCLTYKRVEEAIPILEELTFGANCIELRVDLLESQEPSFVREQLLLLQRHTDLPVIFTVRTKAQGGAFDGTQEEIFALMTLAVRLAVAYIDVEQQWAEKTKCSLFSAIERPPDGKKRTQAIVSEHCYAPGLSRSDLLHIFHLCEERGRADVVKVVVKAFTPADVFKLREVAAGAFHTSKPVIALAVTPKGQLSRVLNAYLCPVTHPALPAAAAPGQMSVKDIHATRGLLGAFSNPAKKLYLIGTGISRSPSPAMHNAVFEALSLPLSYSIFDTKNENGEISALFKDETFYGGNVTIPFKRVVIPLLSKLSASALAIGAVNTVVRCPDTGELFGDNTDWLGISLPLQRALRCSSPGDVSQASATVGLVIGAGGTSRAAAFALSNMDDVDTVVVWNPRTFSKAVTLAQEFSAVAVESLEQVSALGGRVVAVVGTIPPIGQTEPVLTSLATHVLKPYTPVVLDAVYLPRRTGLLQAAAAAECVAIEGKEMLLEQGVFGSERWIRARTYAPVMRAALLRHMEAMEQQ